MRSSARIVVALAAASLVLGVASPALADPSADVSVSKSDSPDPVVPGANISYSIGVLNSGPDSASAVTVSDTTPTNTTFVSLVFPVGWNCTYPAVGATGAVSCTDTTDLLSAGTAAFTLTVRVDPGTADATVISNTASVASTTADADLTDNSATTTTTVGLVLDLCTITGTNQSDTIDGTAGDDVICGGNGSDTINGLGGNDVILGANGKDVIDGGDGNDTLMGRNGKDDITGGAGLDVFTGGNGKDTLDAQDGAGGDVLDGGNGMDECLTDTGDTATTCP